MDIGVADIHKWHVQRGIFSPRGLSGYHGVLRRDGTLELGREMQEVGAHAIGHNFESVSVCLAGGVEEDGKTPEDNFTVEQWSGLVHVIDFWLAVWPDLIICGHRDLGAKKACPSFEAEGWLLAHYGEAFTSTNTDKLAAYLTAYRKERDRS